MKENSENWDTYIAKYEEGRPGSTTLRMDLIHAAPLKEYPISVITGLNYTSNREDGFPEQEAFEEIHKKEDRITQFVNANAEGIVVGSFMSNSQRLSFFYLRAENNIQRKLEQFYASEYPGEEYFLLVEKDSKWKHYKTFLYPNEATLNYMADQAVLRNLESAGDDLTQPRRVDHWIYFDSKKKRDRFVEKILNERFTVEKADDSGEGKKNLLVQIWRKDHVDLDSIHEITRYLRTLADDFDGQYDGWETFVIT